MRIFLGKDALFMHPYSMVGHKKQKKAESGIKRDCGDYNKSASLSHELDESIISSCFPLCSFIMNVSPVHEHA